MYAIFSLIFSFVLPILLVISLGCALLLYIAALGLGLCAALRLIHKIILIFLRARDKKPKS